MALVAALGMTRPDDWQEDEEEEEEEDQEDEEGDGGDDEAEDDASVAATEVMEERLEEEDLCNDAEAGETVASSSGFAAQDAASDHTTKKVKMAKLEASPALARQLDALDAHRSVALNVQRAGGCVVPATRESDRARILRFIKWMGDTLTFKSPPTLTIFAHSRIGPVAHQYIKELVEKHQRKYSYAAKMAASFVIAAKFVASRRTTTTATDDVPVAQLAALHRQCSQQARQEDQFDVGRKMAFLDWEAVQRVRVAAEKALGSAKTKAAKLKLTRDVMVLRLLADQPPDRVGVVRTLRLGGSLKRKPDTALTSSTSRSLGRTRPPPSLVQRAHPSTQASHRGWTATSQPPTFQETGFYFTLAETNALPSHRPLGADASKRRLRATATSHSARRMPGPASLLFCAVMTTMMRRSRPQPSR